MGYIDYYENGFNPASKTYKIRIKDEFDRVTELPVAGIEEFTELLRTFGREKVVLNRRDNSIELIPRAVAV